MGEHWRLAGVGTGILLLILLLRQGEQFPHRGQVLGAPSVGEQSVVADAVEAGRQDVYEEAADDSSVARVMILRRRRPLIR